MYRVRVMVRAMVRVRIRAMVRVTVGVRMTGNSPTYLRLTCP